MDLELTGKHALVCASTQGLGFAVAQSLAREGADVFICGRSPDSVNRAIQSLQGENSRVRIYGMPIDLTAADAPQKLAASATKALDGVDILVTNVGGPAPSTAQMTTEASWRGGFEQIFLSAVLLAQILVGPMRQRKFGRIISITSISAVEPIEHLAVSTTMRQALTGFAKTLSQEVALDGVTVNTVMPGVIHTQRIEDLRKAKAARDGTTLEFEMAQTARMIPTGRLGRPEEFANLVTFLASPRASYITGSNIAVDGGLRRGI